MKRAILIAFAVALAGCDSAASLVKPKTYQAVVAYHKGDDLAYVYGSKTTREKCTAEARNIMNRINYNADSDNRATGWVCLVWQGGRKVGKVR